MRIAIVGASSAGVSTARLLIEHKHDVVIIEKDKARIDELSEELDCGFLHGDGSRPRILKEAGELQYRCYFWNMSGLFILMILVCQFIHFGKQF